MNKYSSYKDSEIKWLDQIPSSWERSRIRMVGNLYGGLTGKKGDDFNREENKSNKPFVPFTNISKNTYISKDHFQYVNVEEGENQNRVLKNDLFFLMSSESYEDLGKSSILLEDVEELYLNSFCKGYRVKDNRVYPLFLNYQLLGSLHKEMISIEGNGFTRINLRQDRLLDIPVFIPPQFEQEQIVSFLDGKTKKIDSLIKQKEKKIELLKEKRTSLINQVVTKGLDQNKEMKYSGVEWIGNIPRDWIILRMCFVFKPVSIKNTSGEMNLSVYRDYGVIPTHSRNDNHNVISEDTSNYKLVEKGDFVMNKMKCWMGSLGLSDYRGIVSPSYTVMKPLIELNHKFIHFLLRSKLYIPQYKKLSYGVREGQWDLRFEDFRELPCLIPPISDQQQIVDYLNKQTKEIETLIQLEEKKIILLKEYRQTLISEVVTGKIRVCEEDNSLSLNSQTV